MLDILMKDEIVKCLEILEKGGTILYPTDTIWGIGCDALNEKAVEKVYLLKKRMESKSLIILLDDPEKLPQYVKKVPEIAWDLIRNVDTPVTIIFPNGINLPENVIGEDNVSGFPTPLMFKDISKEILNQVDYVVSLFHDEFMDVKPSRIIRLNEEGEFRIIRK